MATLTVPDVAPSPTEDSQRLMRACRGLGTDEKAIISILGHRNRSQRGKIGEAYQQLYGESLIHRLDSELSGDLRRAMILWTHDPAERDAILANEVLKGRNHGVQQLQVILEIACANSPHHLQSVKQAYCALYHSSLEEHIASAVVSQPLRKLLVGLVSSYRYDKEVVDMEFAQLESAKLYEALEIKELGHQDVVYILTTRNVYQLKATFDLYEQRFGTHILQDLKCYGKGDLESLLRITIQCIVCPEKHFAEVIRTSMVGLGTDEDSLSRAIVSRAEVDMAKVKMEYSNMFGANLSDDVIGETSGDYKDTLLTLLGATI